MRKLAILSCAVIAALAAVGGLARAAEPTAGVLSVERGRGVVMLELRGSVLGRLTGGTLRVTDLTPGDRYEPLVAGRKLTQERLGSRTVVYRGQGLRFRMLGGRYRIVARGNGIDISAVGRGVVVLDGEPRSPDEDTGVYSLDGADCGLEPALCSPLPTEPTRLTIGTAPDERPERVVRT